MGCPTITSMAVTMSLYSRLLSCVGLENLYEEKNSARMLKLADADVLGAVLQKFHNFPQYNPESRGWGWDTVAHLQHEYRPQY